MRIPKVIQQKRMEAFLGACRKKGLKLTQQRLEVYRELASSGHHPDAGTIHRRVRQRMPTISLDTVYRNLRLLEKHGLISIVGDSRERLRFDADLGPHHHFICVKCWKICDFRSDEFQRLDWPQAAEALGRPLSVHLEVRGVCRSCQRA